MSPRILVVEDDPDQLLNYSYALQQRGYTVLGCSDSCQAEQQLQLQPPAIALLDVHLGTNPDAGFEFCQRLLSRFPALPVLFITSRTDEIDQIFGLRLGAWDYLTKPVSLQLLGEKVAAILKRSARRLEPPTELAADRDLQLDLQGARARWQGQPLNLTVTELLIVDALVGAAGAVVSFDALADKTRQSVVTNNTLSTHIRHLRNKFKAVDSNFDRLSSVYGLGYRWQQPE
tara:strand:+ start:2119 stop:2811 length:693 start_codon:yes stop_codon:yes gene_type:complete